MAKAESGFARGSEHRAEAENPFVLFWTAVRSGVAAFVTQLTHQKKGADDLGYLRAARAVGELSRLDAGSNSEGIGRVSDQARTRATELLVALQQMNRSLSYRVPAPAVAPTPDGGVLLAWHVAAPDGELEVEAIVLDRGGEFYIGYSEAEEAQQLAPIDNIEAIARRIGKALQPYLIG